MGLMAPRLVWPTALAAIAVLAIALWVALRHNASHPAPTTDAPQASTATHPNTARITPSASPPSTVAPTLRPASPESPTEDPYAEQERRIEDRAQRHVAEVFAALNLREEQLDTAEPVAQRYAAAARLLFAHYAKISNALNAFREGAANSKLTKREQQKFVAEETTKIVQAGQAEERVLRDDLWAALQELRPILDAEQTAALDKMIGDYERKKAEQPTP